MEISHTEVLERIARVLAGFEASINGRGDGRSVSAEVDADWRSHLDEARAVLNAIREPDRRMAEAGDAEIWTRMVCAGLGNELPAPFPERKSWAGEVEVYQKPLG